MKKLTSLTEPVFSLTGSPIVEEGKPITIGTLLANAVATGYDSNPVRAMEIARKLFGDDEVDLEEPDYLVVVRCVEQSQMANFARAAALDYLSKVSTPDS